MDDPVQPAAAAGVKVPPEASLAQLLDAIDLGSAGLVWRAECINAVEWDGYDSPWSESWDEPLILPDERLREQAADGRQVINGRFTGEVAGSEAVTIEAIDSTFWLVWSDDPALRERVRQRFPSATNATRPSPWHPHG